MHGNTEHNNIAYDNNNSYLSVIPCVKSPCALLHYLLYYVSSFYI